MSLFCDTVHSAHIPLDGYELYSYVYDSAEVGTAKKDPVQKW